MLARLTPGCRATARHTDRYAEDFLSRSGCDWNKAEHHFGALDTDSFEFSHHTTMIISAQRALKSDWYREIYG